MKMVAVHLPFAAVLFVMVGCGPNQEAMTFYDNVLNSRKRLKQSFDLVDAPMARNNVPEARLALKKTEETLAAIKAESADDLLASNNKYLKLQEELLASLLQIVENKELNAAERERKMVALALAMEEREKAVNADFTNKQVAFVQAYKIPQVENRK